MRENGGSSEETWSGYGRVWKVETAAFLGEWGIRCEEQRPPGFKPVRLSKWNFYWFQRRGRPLVEQVRGQNFRSLVTGVHCKPDSEA